jgi:L-cysteine S-thiosulfotransferase
MTANDAGKLVMSSLPFRSALTHFLRGCALLAVVCCTPAQAAAPIDPARDFKEFRDFFKKRFPDLAFADYADGVGAIDATTRAEWLSMEELQPYAQNIRNGRKLFETAFKNGAHYADCFADRGIGIRQNYPYFDSKSGQVKTLELAINECRARNGETTLDYTNGALADISAYMAYTSRGKRFAIKVPEQALDAYARGRQFYFSKRGQLNLSCADCHMHGAGRRLRADILSPELGHTTHFPVYRSNTAGWSVLDTLHHRYRSCNSLVRAKPLAPQSETYRDLEFFETYISNGLPVNGPAIR